MFKKRVIISAGLLIAGNAVSSSFLSEPIYINAFQAPSEQKTHPTKRSPQKIYHRFEEIPEISDKEASLYKKNEYTYIVNADVYQQTGKLKLKRVLKDEVTKANTLGLIYRSECADYFPTEQEDQIIHYAIDMKLIDASGKFKGPSQMNDAAITSFIRYLAATPKTRPYVLPLLKYTPSQGLPATLPQALIELEKLYYDEGGHMRPMTERKNLISGKLFNSITLNNSAWQKIASQQLKKFINKESSKRASGLSNTTKNYLCLTELFPSSNLLQQALENYNLTSFPLGRVGKPKDVMLALALSMNLKDVNGNLDATRIPTYAIAASISHINWKGNGTSALKNAQTLRSAFRVSWTNGLKQLKNNVKLWVTGKSRRSGVDELAKLNMLTPTLIQQYQTMELAGADNLAFQYQKAVTVEENKISSNKVISFADARVKQY